MRPNVLVHNIWLPDIQDSATFNKISTLQQDKVNGTTSEESTLYPVIEEEMPNKQQKVSRGNPDVNVEHNNSCKRAKKKTKKKKTTTTASQSNLGKQASLDPSGGLLKQVEEMNTNYKSSEVGENPEN